MGSPWVLDRIIQLLTSIASDLDLMLQELCRSIPYPVSSKTEGQFDSDHNHVERELELLEHYMDGVGQEEEDEEDEEGSAGSLADQQESAASSSELDFYSAGEDMDQSSGLYFASSEAETPPPSMPAPPPPMRGAGRVEGRRIPLLERLLRTQAVWYLPNIGRAGAVHLLQNKIPGTFIVRQSSRPNTLALSVRLKGHPRIEHYLIESTNRGLRLEGSFHHFSAVPVLVCYYCQHHRDELPITLILPKSILEASTNQELASISLLGQGFWTSSISPKKTTSSNTAPIARYQTGPTFIPITMATQVSGVSHQISMTSQMNGISSQMNGISHIVHEAHSSHKMTKTMSQTTEVLRTFSSGGQATSAKQSISKTVHAHNIVNGNATDAFPPFPTSEPLAITCGHQVPMTTVPVSRQSPTITTASNDYDMMCDGPCIIRPVVTMVTSNGVHRGQYYHGNLKDRTSDYEDVWTSSSPDHTFRPIQTAKSEQELVARGNQFQGQKVEVGTRFSAVNPGYLPDSCSEKDLRETKISNRQNKAVHVSKSQSRLEETPQASQDEGRVHRNELIIGVKQKQPSPVVFTFDLNQGGLRAGSEPREPPSRQPPTPPVRRHVAERPKRQYSSPAYIEPYDSLIGQFDGVNQTSGIVKVSSSMRNVRATDERVLPSSDHAEEVIHSIKLEPIASPRILEKRRHSHRKQQVQQSSTEWDGYDVPQDTFHKMATLSRSHEILSPLHGDQSMVTGQGALGPGYSRSLSLPRHLQDVCLSESQLQQTQSQTDTKTDCSSVDTHQELSSQQTETQTKAKSRSPLISQSFNEHFFKKEAVEQLERGSPSPPVGRFPVYDNPQSPRTSESDEGSTVEDLIADVSPELTLKPIKPLTIGNVSRMSEYDNVTGIIGGPSSRRTGGSSVATYYCQPWDSSLWDDLLNLGSTAHKTSALPTWMTCEGSAIPAHMKMDGDNASSVGDYSLCGSIGESGSFQIHDGQFDDQSEPCRSEVATSFEWKLNDRDSATETTPQPPLLTPLDPAMMEEGEDVEQHVTMEMTSPQDISDDEGVEDVGTGSFRDKLMPFLGTHRVTSLRNRGIRNAAIRVKEYIAGLSEDKDTTFGITIENFIKCTMEGAETNPHIVTRNVRQFMNGMKNYLVHHGEVKLNTVIEQERSKLEEDEFLNIDAIIEGALHKVVIRPLKHHIYSLFVQEHNRNSALQVLSENLRYARTKTPQELGIRDGIIPPEGSALEEIKLYLNKMQRSYSPLKKLENLLGATSTIYNSVQSQETGSRETLVSLGADDFLPLFVWVLVQCGVVSVEVEAEYMWGLLHPCLLVGEGGYYLTTLSSAVTALKNIRPTQLGADQDQQEPLLSCLSDLQAFMKILIPDEQQDSIITKTLPVRPNMTARDVCTMIAHKFKVTNPQDYGLYVLVDGVEDRLGESVCPQTVKTEIISDGRECLFAFKRNNAKFAWPVFNR